MIRFGGLVLAFVSFWAFGAVLSNAPALGELPWGIGFPVFMVSLFVLVAGVIVGFGMLIGAVGVKDEGTNAQP